MERPRRLQVNYFCNICHEKKNLEKEIFHFKHIFADFFKSFDLILMVIFKRNFQLFAVFGFN